jgi:hypothetical protein
MSTATPGIRELADRLVARAAAGEGSSVADASEVLRVCRRLREPLARLAGAAGFASLLSRALAVAKRREPSLEGIRVAADGSLEGLDAVQRTAEEAGRGGAALLAELLGLLVLLIGEPMTWSLVSEAWPDVPVEAQPPATEENP